MVKINNFRKADYDIKLLGYPKKVLLNKII